MLVFKHEHCLDAILQHRESGDLSTKVVGVTIHWLTAGLNAASNIDQAVEETEHDLLARWNSFANTAQFSIVRRQCI
ncbi:MAG: hypothetical protein OXU66_06305 [Gammaproteobacteria bacterium]|nr:hypothetical protein [Gammaproteobacteria bacterium]MDD9958538.1 hypothetical protein [Gammaproteobacteria bacterium]